MSEAPRVTFVERRSYRRRRLADALRMLPVAGALLFCVPMLWPTEPGAAIPVSSAIIYIFLVWAGLVVLSAVLATTAARQQRDTGDEDT
jgi:hypothetical protein